jgi:CHAT domain-containing protein/tetratricopeptide (TPR) repeat protein
MARGANGSRWVRFLGGALRILVLAGTAAAPPGPARASGRQAALAEADRLTASYREAYRRGAFARAESLAVRQLEIRKAHLGPEHLDVAASLEARGVYLRALGEDERAAHALRQAVAIRVEVLGPRHPDVAHAERELALALIGPRRVIEADSLCRAALEIQRVALGEMHPETQVTLGLLGQVLVSRGRGLEGEQMLRKALEGLRAATQDSEELQLQLATVELDLTRTLANRARYDEAEALVTHALRTRREIFGDRHPDYAHALGTLAVIAQNRNDPTRATDLTQESYEILRQALGEENRLVIAKMGDVALAMTGSWQARKSSIVAAEAWFRKAEPLTRRVFGEHHPQYGSLLSGLGWNLVLQDRAAEAESVLARAQAICEVAGGEDDPDASATVGYRARLAYQERDYAKSEALLRRRLAYVEREKGTTNRTYISMVEGIGIMRGAQGDFAGAEQYLSRAAEVYERVRLRAGQGGARASFWTSPYERVALARMELGRSAEAWAAVERLRGLAIADMLMASRGRSLDPIEKARQDSLAAVLGDLENRLGAARGAASRDPQARVEANVLHEDLMAAESAWNDFQSAIERKQPVTESRTFSLERVQRSLDGATAIVGWLEGEFAPGSPLAWGYVIRDHGPVHWVRLDLGEPGAWWFRTPGMQFRAWLTGPARSALGAAAPDTSGQEHKLWDRRFAPLLPHLAGARNLVLVPSSALRGLPLEAIRDPQGELLGTRYAVQYAMSSTTHAWLTERSRGRHAIRRGLLVGDPPFREQHLQAMRRGQEPAADSTGLPAEDVLQSVLRGERSSIGKLPRLPWSRREIDGVAATLPQADRLLGSDASERRLVELVDGDRLGQYDVLHFATHAITSDGRPEESALVLAQVETSPSPPTSAEGTRALDGLVSAAEVIREWSLGADLVTLSACETAQGQSTSEGTFGIAQAFLRAGARAVLVSLWDVDDEATALLMQRFYATWLGTGGGKGRPALSKAQALQEAKRWLRDRRDTGGQRRFEHPYYWAGFVLMGDGR